MKWLCKIFGHKWLCEQVKTYRICERCRKKQHLVQEKIVKPKWVDYPDQYDF